MRSRAGFRLAINHRSCHPEWETEPIERIITVETRRFDRAWKLNPMGYYVGPGGQGQQDGRYDKFGVFFWASLIRGHPLRCSICCLTPVGTEYGVSFVNGRHRYAWLRDAGLNPVPIAVPTEEVRLWLERMDARILPVGRDLWW